MSKIKSYTSSSGMKTVHYDENRNKVGESWRSASGGKVTHYDANGNKTGVSYGNQHGRMTHYDSDGNHTGASYGNSSGRIRHYDNNWNQTGKTNPSFWGYTSETTKKPTSNSQLSHDTINAISTGCAWIIAAPVLLFMLVAFLKIVSFFIS